MQHSMDSSFLSHPKGDADGVVLETEGDRETTFALPEEASGPERLPHSSPASPGVAMSVGLHADDIGRDLQLMLMQQHKEIMMQLAAHTEMLEGLRSKARAPFEFSLVQPNPPPAKEKRPSQCSARSVDSARSAVPGGDMDVVKALSLKPRRGSEKPAQRTGRRRFLKSFSAVDRAMRRVAAEAHRTRQEMLPSQPDSGRARTPLPVTICEHPLFEVFFTLIILSNAIFIGIETQHYIDYPDDARWDFFYVTVVFTTLFIFELIMRVLAYGRKVFCGSDDWMWGWLDVTICITGVLQLTDDFYLLTQHGDGDSSTNSSVRAFRIIRVARILRAVRVVRVLRFVTALRTLVMSIFHTLKALFWALVLLILIVYVFATLFSFAVHEYKHIEGELPAAQQEVAERHFNSVPRTMLSLFMAISGGMNWRELVYVLEEISVAWEFCFLFYVSFTYFAVLNVVTAVFCQAAIDSAQQDQASVIQSILENKEMHLDKIRALFSQFGGEECNTITFAMFESTIQEPKVREYFESLGLDIWDAWSFFKMLDLDNGGEVEIDEFLMGCLRLRGNARAVDVGKLIHDQNWLIKNFGRFQGHVEVQLSHLLGLMASALGAENIIEGLTPGNFSRGTTPWDKSGEKLASPARNNQQGRLDGRP